MHRRHGVTGPGPVDACEVDEAALGIGVESTGGPVQPTVNARPRLGDRSAVEQLLTVRELTGLLRLHVKTVERMARAGRLSSLRVFGAG